MGDCVIVEGGTELGRDHFPWAAQDELNVGDNYLYKFGIDLARACKWFYRVKRWHVVAVCSALRIPTSGSPSDATWSFSFDFQFNVFFEDPETFEALGHKTANDVRESDLVANSYVDSLNFTTETTQSDFNHIDDDPEATNIGHYVTNFTSANAGGRSKSCSFYFVPWFMRWNGGAFWLPFTCNISDPDFSVTTSFQASASATGSLSVDGVTTPWWARQFHTTAPYDEFTGYSVTMTPKEYWPYATTAGLPVYDTTTGAELRDPFS